MNHIGGLGRPDRMLPQPGVEPPGAETDGVAAAGTAQPGQADADRSQRVAANEHPLAHRLPVTAEHADTETGGPAGGYAAALRAYREAVVTDLGPGIDPDVLERVLPRTAWVPVRAFESMMQVNVGYGPHQRPNTDLAAEGLPGVHAVEMSDGKLVCLNSESVAAAGLVQTAILTTVHQADDLLEDWPHEWDAERIQANAVPQEVREIDGMLRYVGEEDEKMGDKPQLSYPAGTAPQSWGDVVNFYSAERIEDCLPTVYGIVRRPAGPKSFDVKADEVLTEAEKPILDDFMVRMNNLADHVLHDLGSVTLLGFGNRIKPFDSIAEKYYFECKSGQDFTAALAEEVRDAVR